MVTQAPVGGASIDHVTDPVMLAHQLLTIPSGAEKHEYARKLRISSISDVCVREVLLGIRNGVSSKRFTNVGLQVTFDIGHAFHEFIQNSQEYLGRKKVGWWRCSACGVKYFGRYPVQRCSSCNAYPEAFRHEEHSLSLPEEIPVSGHPDDFLEIAPGDIRVVDYKSLSGDEFKKLTAPKAEHIIQVTGYMEYLQYDLKLPAKINSRRGLLIYMSKQHVAQQFPFKVFHVDRQQSYVDIIKAKVADLQQGLKDQNFLPTLNNRCELSEFTDSRSRQCPVHDICQRLFCNQLQK